ncbi:hypothetical protein LCGC14_2863090 [marine sediment metagenome]|uniref:Uncharacterized protein n=1 Tax=marine sediment metagenome TaxID=412755 RepID=A0A0F8Y505_9ZZZZ
MEPAKAGIYIFIKDGKRERIEIRIASFLMGKDFYTLRVAGKPGGKDWYNLDFCGEHEYSNGEWING